jgi:hypothetical protein
MKRKRIKKYVMNYDSGEVFFRRDLKLTVSNVENDGS